jgi:hypothetical protein
MPEPPTPSDENHQAASSKWGTACLQCAQAKAKCLRIDPTAGSRCDRFVFRMIDFGGIRLPYSFVPMQVSPSEQRLCRESSKETEKGNFQAFVRVIPPLSLIHLPLHVSPPILLSITRCNHRKKQLKPPFLSLNSSIFGVNPLDSEGRVR